MPLYSTAAKQLPVEQRATETSKVSHRTPHRQQLTAKHRLTAHTACDTYNTTHLSISA
jgi:hypothetical protein